MLMWLSKVFSTRLCYCTIQAVADESSKLRRQFLIARKCAHAGVKVKAAWRHRRAQRRVAAGSSCCGATTGFTAFADELTSTVEDGLLLLFAPLLDLHTLGQPPRAHGEVQQPQRMLGVSVALHHQGVFGDPLHQRPRRLCSQPPQLRPGLNGDLQPFQDGALKGQRAGTAVTFDGLLDVDAEAVWGLLGLRGPRFGLALVRPLTLPAGWHEAAPQVDASQQGGAVAGCYGGVSGNQFNKAQMCCCGSSSSMTHGEDLHPSSRLLPPAVLAVYDHFDHLHGAVLAAPAARRGVPQLDPAGLVLAAQPAGAVVDAALWTLADAPQGGPAQVREKVGGRGRRPSVFSLFDCQVGLGGQRAGGWNHPGRGHRHVRFHFGIYHDSLSTENLRKSKQMKRFKRWQKK